MDFVAGEILPLYKPYGWTSFQIVSKVRYHLSRHHKVKRFKVAQESRESGNRRNGKMQKQVQTTGSA